MKIKNLAFVAINTSGFICSFLGGAHNNEAYFIVGIILMFISLCMPRD